MSCASQTCRQVLQLPHVLHDAAPPIADGPYVISLHLLSQLVSVMQQEAACMLWYHCSPEEQLAEQLAGAQPRL